MKKSLMNKSTLKILSLLIAILIWVVVKNVQDPMLVRIITRIPVTIVNESYLASNLEIPLLIDGQDTVNVKVKGRESVVKGLEREDFQAVADMTQIVSMDTTPRMVPVKVTCEGVEESDISVTPGNIQVDIEEVADDERSFHRIARKTGMDAGEIAKFIREVRPVIYGGRVIDAEQMKVYIDKMNEIINHI